MALSDLNVTKLNRMCPVGHSAQIGTEINARAELIDTTTTPPAASSGNVGKFFFDTSGPHLYFCTDASTMTKLT
jgi:hypothetical protein